MKQFTQDLFTYLKPLWKGEKMVNETLMFVGKEDVGVLMYKPKEVLSLYDYRLEKKYEKDVDYKVEGKNFYRLSENIPYWQEEEYYQTVFEKYRIGANKEICEKMGGERFLKYGEGDTFTKMQVAITYTHDDCWTGPVPQGKSEKFSTALSKLKTGKKCKMLFYGDSITTGCNASATPQGGETPPYMPPFPNLICQYLQKRYSAEIELINTAVGGMSTKWGLDNVQERVIDYSPDLVFLAFGMNDPATPRATYKSMIKETIEKIRAALPETEIMLVSSILPNNESDENWFANQCVFHLDLADLEKEYSFVGLADITQMQKHILTTGKRYRDMTANNINHPNDFTHRLYAQVMLTTLLGEEFEV